MSMKTTILCPCWASAVMASNPIPLVEAVLESRFPKRDLIEMPQRKGSTRARSDAKSTSHRSPERRRFADPRGYRRHVPARQRRRGINAGEIPDIEVLDHIGIGDEDWVSLHGAKLIP